jgi:hypothetical protein
MGKTKLNIIPFVQSRDERHETLRNECICLKGPWCSTVHFCVLNPVPCTTDPQMVDSIVGEKSWLNLCLCACLTGTKKSAVVFQRKKKFLHNAFIF